MSISAKYVELYKHMFLARQLEDRLRSLYFRGEIAGGVYLGKGQEAFSAAHGMMLRKGDVFSPAIRDMAGRLAFGESIDNALRVYLGRRTSTMRGRDGNIHRGNLKEGMIPMISHLGAMISTVGGMFMARRLKGELEGDDLSVGLCSLGDGAMGCGASHEGLNLLAVEKLPVVIMVANNQLAYSTLNDRSFACKDFADRALGYGIASHSCDGEDPLSCLEAAQAAVAAARRGEGPQMVIATMLRLTGHGEHDDATYTPPDLMAKAKDCLQVGEQQLLEAGYDTEAIAKDVAAQLDQAVADNLAEPEPDPDAEDWCAYSERWLDQGLVP